MIAGRDAQMSLVDNAYLRNNGYVSSHFGSDGYTWAGDKLVCASVVGSICRLADISD
jgi:hypothetical protein